MLRPEIAEARYRALDREIDRFGLDALILVSRAQPGHRGAIRFVADYHFLVRTVYAVAFPGEVPILLTENKAERHQARTASGMDRVEFALDPAEGLERMLEQHGVRNGRVGITGLAGTMPLGDYEALVARCLKIEFVDATEAFEAARAVKSPAEHEMVREASAIADAAYNRFLELARPGVSELELQAEVERIERLRGMSDNLTLVESGPVNKFVKPPRDRSLEAGDLITFWVEVAGPDGFWVERGGMASLGEPSEEARMLFDVCLETMVEGAKELRPGARACDAARRVKEIGSAAGLILGVWSGHGIGLDVTEAPSIVSDDESVLQEGMVISLHPHVLLPDESNGGHVGETYIVRSDGGEPLSRLPHEFHVLG